MAMSGKWKITVDTSVLANGDSIAAYLTSAAGTLLTHTTDGSDEALDVYQRGVYAEDDAHNSGDLGSFALAVRNDTPGSLVSADGDYAPLQVDSSGSLRVTSSGVYNEDDAASNGDAGSSVLLVRQDTLAASTSADGDYGNFKSNNLGELYVHDTSVLAQLVTTDAVIDNIYTEQLDQGTTLDSILTEVLDQGTTLDSILSDTSSIDSTLTALSKAEDAVHSSGDQGIQALAVRKDALSSNVSADGDYASLLQWSEGSLKVVDISNIAVLQQEISVATSATQLPASSLANRRSILVQNVGNSSIWIGSSSVTVSGATGGIEIPKGGHVELEAGPTCEVYGIASGSAVNARLLEMS